MQAGQGTEQFSSALTVRLLLAVQPPGTNCLDVFWIGPAAAATGGPNSKEDRKALGVPGRAVDRFIWPWVAADTRAAFTSAGRADGWSLR